MADDEELVLPSLQTAPKPRCPECRRFRKVYAKGLCGACYMRHYQVRTTVDGQSLAFPRDETISEEAVRAYAAKVRKRLFAQVLKNPRKFLDEVSG